ncbi:hypothetical protein UFOVP236_64 [uncultured Caudovirales phage]|uniref:Uncharacterized protein n=1 Tax=uncultured Caudovirales phage TaxID=2100421 RepID=A0A6J7WUU8_9CAUD|nr:hypothetical protein UFOVP236_64 [uncultured Caudovirales phage]
MMSKLLHLLSERLRRPTIMELAMMELREAEIHRMTAQTTKEYAAGLIVYRDAQIERLRKLIATLDKPV